MQTVADANARIINVVAHWPGSTHDSIIFQNSRLYHRLEAGEFGQFLLVADSGYRNTNYMVTPYLNPITPEQILFNMSHIKTRNVVERSYGILKRRWPVLSMGMRVQLRTIQMIIVACAVLHNIAIDENDRMPPDEIEEFDQVLADVVVPNDAIPVENQNQRVQARRNRNNDARDLLTRQYFHNLLVNVDRVEQ